MNAKRKGLLSAFEYLVVFACFLMIFFFIYPQCDVFLFAQATDGTLESIWNHSLYYGNGRLLGNLFGVFFSNFFEYAGVLCAAILTLLVWEINQLVFKNDRRTVFLIALLLAFPGAGILSECYFIFAAFANYVIPMVFILASVLIVRYFYENDVGGFIKKGLLYLTLILSGVCACLFSENTTFVFDAAATLLVAYSIFNFKKVKFAGLLNFLTAFAGSIIMLLIPKVTQSSHKMDDYRSLPTSIKGLIGTSVGNMVRFTEVFGTFTIVIMLLSVLFLFLTVNKTKNNKIKQLQTAIFILYPIFSFLLGIINSNLMYLPRAMIFHTIFFCLYAAAIVILVIQTKEPKLRFGLICFILMVGSSFVPMLVVNQSGYRTYYTTFMILLVFALGMIKTYVLPKIDKESIIRQTAKAVTCTVAVLFVCVSLVMSLQMVYNFNIYSERTRQIQIANSNQAEVVEVPITPCDTLHYETRWPKVVADINRGKDTEVRAVILSNCENAEDYQNILSASVAQQIKMAFENLEYKNPLI